ncbi:hypothetical protein D3C72_1661310 [compost metagenome]
MPPEDAGDHDSIQPPIRSLDLEDRAGYNPREARTIKPKEGEDGFTTLGDRTGSHFAPLLALLGCRRSHRKPGFSVERGVDCLDELRVRGEDAD